MVYKHIYIYICEKNNVSYNITMFIVLAIYIVTIIVNLFFISLIFINI